MEKKKEGQDGREKWGGARKHEGRPRLLHAIQAFPKRAAGQCLQLGMGLQLASNIKVLALFYS